MKRGFVFGKYLPFHKGHEALIDFALKQCDEVIVVVCASEAEDISLDVRKKWIQASFPQHPALNIFGFEYDEENLPNTSVSSVEVSRIWSRKFEEILPPMDVVITSEPYGEHVAEFMGIQHIPFDPARATVPISATQIRKAPHLHWQFLPDAVKAFYQRKIVLLGTESTGKSSIALEVSRRLGASLVTEAGRDIIPDSTEFSQNQLYQIASAHAAHMVKTSKELKPFVIMDTDIHITQSYAKFEFGSYLALDNSMYAANQVDLYLYLTADFPFIQDGTRMEEEDRNRLDKSHRATLADFGVEFVEVSGNWEERLIEVERLCKEIIGSVLRLDHLRKAR